MLKMQKPRNIEVTSLADSACCVLQREELDIGLFVKAHFSNLTEKGVAILRSDLVALDTECAEEV